MEQQRFLEKEDLVALATGAGIDWTFEVGGKFVR